MSSRHDPAPLATAMQENPETASTEPQRLFRCSARLSSSQYAWPPEKPHFTTTCRPWSLFGRVAVDFVTLIRIHVVAGPRLGIDRLVQRADLEVVEAHLNRHVGRRG